MGWDGMGRNGSRWFGPQSCFSLHAHGRWILILDRGVLLVQINEQPANVYTVFDEEDDSVHVVEIRYWVCVSMFLQLQILQCAS